MKPTASPLLPGRDEDAAAPIPSGSRAAVAVALALLAGAALRFITASDLWLDEALSVNIASLPLSELRGGLLRDGAPPLYYVLLHGWMEVFGNGDLAVRALSGVFGVACLPLMWKVASKEGGRRLAVASVLLLASSPFAIRYATEARMYSLLMLLVLVAYLALASVLEEPRPARMAGLAVVTALLFLTHYWSFYLVAVVGALLLRPALKGPDPRRYRAALASIAAGGLLFLPWAPTFLFQLRHTGTPWADPASFTAIILSVDRWAGGVGVVAPFLAILMFALVGLALWGRPTPAGRIELTGSPRPLAVRLAVATFGTVALAIAVGLVLGSGFSERYTSVVLPIFLLLVALGLSAFGSEKARNGFLVAAVLLGLVTSAGFTMKNRTQAGEIAEAINEKASAGDVVVYCPDQLGPAVDRLLTTEVHQIPFPAAGPAAFVDGVE